MKNIEEKMLRLCYLTACLSALIFWYCTDVPSVCSDVYPHPYDSNTHFCHAGREIPKDSVCTNYHPQPYDSNTHFCHPSLDGREISKNDGRECSDDIEGVEPCTPPCIQDVNCDDDVGRCIIAFDDENEGEDECREDILRSECAGSFEVGVCPTPDDPIGACTVREHNCNANVLQSECRGDFVANETCPELPTEADGFFVDLRDGQVYRMVTMPDQKIWMAENLNFITTNSWCYEDDLHNCDRYGRLYTWEVAQVACPSGWRLPTNSDWTTLIGRIDTDAVTKLKADSGWHDDANGTDDFGFTALPGGFRNNNQIFRRINEVAIWWTSIDRESDNHGVYIQIEYNDTTVRQFNISKSHAFSVRCIRNQE